MLIQFGQKDEVETKKSYTPKEALKQNLIRFISESRTQKAHPVLITPVARRQFDTDGKLQETHAIYSELTRSVAWETNTPLIDLDRQRQELLQTFGAENSKLLFLHLAPGEHPNYPDAKWTTPISTNWLPAEWRSWCWPLSKPSN